MARKPGPPFDPPTVVSISAQRALQRITNAEFLGRLFPPLYDDEILCWTHFSGSHHGRGGWPDKWVHNPFEVVAPSEHHTFFSPSLYNQPARKITSFSRLCLLVIDDIDPDEVKKRLEPSYIIRTSVGKYQAGWRLEAPITDYEDAQQFLRIIYAGKFKKDAGGQILPTRYVRLPVGTNATYEDKPKQTLIHFKTIGYTVEQLCLALGGVPEDKAIVSGKGWDGISNEAQSLPRNDVGKITDGRFMLCFRWSMFLANQGKTVDEIEDYMRPFTHEHFDGGKAWWDRRSRELHKTIRSAVAKKVREYKEETPVPYVPEVPADDEWPREIPRQPFCLYPFFPRGVATTLVAGGGTGKSLLIAHLAAHAASGKPFGPYLFDRPMKVAIFTYEDNRAEYKRRLTPYLDGIAVKHYQERIRVFDNTGEESAYWVGYDKGDRQLHDTGMCDAIIETLRDYQPDFVFFDTLSQMNGADEDNATFSKIAKLLSYFARELNCAVVVAHHVSKVAQLNSVIAQAASRGGSALIDNTRGGVQLVTLSSKNIGEVFRGKEIEEAVDSNRFVAMIHTKANYAGMAAAMLFERTSDAKANTAWLRCIDTSTLKDKPTKEDRTASDMEVAMAWLEAQDEAVPVRVVRDMPANRKPTGLRGSLASALAAAVEAGLAEVVGIKRGGRDTQAYQKMGE